MRIYIAGFGAGGLVDKFPEGDVHFLESYFYMNPRIEMQLKTHKTKVFMDSGAFSARTLGVTITLDAYAKYLTSHEDIYEMAAILDAPIGDCEGSYRALKTLEDAGCRNVHPVLHAGEPEKWAERYIKEGYTYLLLGGLVKYGRANTQQYLDRLFENVLCDRNGKPRIRTHGFGLTTFSLVKRYPWTSVDSTRWLFGGKAGTIFLPRGNDIQILGVSSQSPWVKIKDKHFDTLPKVTRDSVTKQVESLGFDMPSLRAEYRVRNRFNIQVFNELQKILHTDTFHRVEQGLFDA